MNIKTHQCEVVIIGAGVAGLWLHARLRSAGYRCVIVENRACGFGQTIASQGIIHGGTKYTLTGRLTPSARALANMPSVWKSCLEGSAKPDLCGAEVLSAHQFLCSADTVGSKFTAFAARAVMQSKMAVLRGDAVPKFIARDSFHGRVYQLNEMVLSVPTVLRALVDGVPRGQIVKVREEGGIELEEGGENGVGVILFDDDGGVRRICCQAVVYTAGLGNEEMCLGNGEMVATQRRPLHMVMARFPAEVADDIPRIYTHYLGVGALPRVTITTHESERNGDVVLYLGGEIAESGVAFDRELQVARGCALAREVLPDLPYDKARWATWRVDRAEPRQGKGRRPDTSVAEMRGRVIGAWPVKLALAPHLADEVLELLRRGDIMPSVGGCDVSVADDEIVYDWERPLVALVPWDREEVLWSECD